eukprot:scaffold3854_cov120-Skeletonema_marinoi.AAC.4
MYRIAWHLKRCNFTCCVVAGTAALALEAAIVRSKSCCVCTRAIEEEVQEQEEAGGQEMPLMMEC